LSRLLSRFLVLAYVTVAGVMAGPRSALAVFGAMLVPLACVWFPEAMGDYTGPPLGRSLARPSPASFVWFLGWILLLLPVMIGTPLWLQGVRLDDWLD